MKTFGQMVSFLEDSPIPPPSGGMPGGDALPGSAPPAMGGMPPMVGGGGLPGLDSLGGMGGGPPAGNSPIKPIQLKSSDVWSVLKKLLDGDIKEKGKTN